MHCTANSSNDPSPCPRSGTFPLKSPESSMSIMPLIRERKPAIEINKNLLRLDWVRDWTNLVVAGGHILNAVINDANASICGDVDIFLVERPDANSDVTTLDAARVAHLLREIHSWLTDHYGSVDYVNYSRMGITFIVERPSSPRKPKSERSDKYMKFTVICSRAFRDVFEVLNSFDLPNCEFAYHNGKVIATDDALTYLEDRTIRVYTLTENLWGEKAQDARRRRLKKYSDRSYNTVLRIEGYRPGRPKCVDKMYQEYAIENYVQGECNITKMYIAIHDVDEAIRLYAADVGRLLKDLA